MILLFAAPFTVAEINPGSGYPIEGVCYANNHLDIDTPYPTAPLSPFLQLAVLLKTENASRYR
jgi:hypothetical protein